MHFYVNVGFLRQCRYDVGMHIASITLLLHHEIIIFFIKMIVHIEKTTINNIMHLEFIKKEFVGTRYAFLRQCRFFTSMSV